MITNPTPAKIGLSPQERAVIVHIDDVGMCAATVSPAVELLGTGAATSASVMAPCAWASAAVSALAPVAGDIGVHLTITSEWEQYRWRPLTDAADLRDDDGCFPRTVEQARTATAGSVAEEVAAQIAWVAARIPISHVDAHMGAVATPAYLPSIFQLSNSAGLVTFLPCWGEDQWRATGLDAEGARAAAAQVAQLAAQGVPMVDHVRSLPLADGDHLAYARLLFADLPAGITHLYLHPADDTPELRAITPDWRGRVANLAALRDPEWERLLRNEGIRLIRYQDIA